MRGDPAQFRRARHRGAMIAGRMRCHSVPRGRIVERKDRISRPARLEGANLLKIFALKKQRCPARLIQPQARQHRRAIDVRANPLMRRTDFIEVD